MARTIGWALGLLLALSLPAVAAERALHGVALVIGQSKYEQLPELTNPSKDARDIDRLLGDLGFDVDRVLNADGDRMREEMDDFVEDAADADVALVYYSGHGIEAKGDNYLAPVDTDLSSPESAGASLIPVQPLLERLSKVAPVVIILLDACRSDPFPPGQMIVLPGDAAPTPVQGQGLAAVRGPSALAKPAGNPDSLGAVIGFAAEPGRPALDGAPGENSPYAAALLKHFSAPGYSFGDVMTMVTEEVYLKTKAQQLPWTNSSLRTVLRFDAAPEEDDGDPDQDAIRTARRSLLLNIAGTPEETQRYVEALAGQEKVPLDALYGMLDVLGVKATDDSGDLEQQLQSGAERLKQLMADKSTSVKSDDELERLSKLADDAEAEGAIALALHYRDQASARADTLLAGKQAEAEKLRQDMLDIGQTYADNAATAILNFDHVHAAELYAKAYDAVKDWDKGKAAGYLVSQADALTDHGYYTTDNDALTQALQVYGDVLAQTPRTDDAEGWARLQDRIGAAQQLLGQRQADPALLKASAVSFENSLEVRTQAAAPDDWAAEQNNLGNTLFVLGTRIGDIPTLQKAVDSFDAALTVYGPESNPVRWATTQNNRATAQMAMADAIYAATEDIQVQALQAGNEHAEDLPEVVASRDRAVAILSGAVNDLQAALAVRPRSDNPLDWAMVQHTLASLLSDRGKLVASADDAKAAADAFRAVLTVYDQGRMPVQWVTTAANLAATLRQYAGLTKDPTPLTEAGDLLRQAIALTPRDKSPLDWAELNTKLGNVYADVVEYDGEVETSDMAVAAYRLAAEVHTPEQDLAAWERLQLYIVQIELKTAVPAQDVARLKDARATSVTASDTLKAHGNADAALFAQWVPLLDQFIAALGG